MCPEWPSDCPIPLKLKVQYSWHSRRLLNLKLVSAIFYEIFIFSPIDSPSKTMKFFYFI